MVIEINGTTLIYPGTLELNVPIESIDLTGWQLTRVPSASHQNGACEHSSDKPFEASGPPH
jgi:hypothetical protein